MPKDIFLGHKLINKQQVKLKNIIFAQIKKICYNYKVQGKLNSRWQQSKETARGKSGLHRAKMLDNV